MAEKICVMSPKGGVGKTTLALNLGLHLAENHGKKTIVLDSNTHAANLSFYLGLPNLPITLNDVIKWNLPVEKAIYAYSRNFHFVPATIRFEKKIDLVNTRHFKEIIDKVSPYYDYIIFDSPPGVGKDVKTLISQSDRTIMITTPDLPTVATCLKGSFLIKKQQKPLSVVVNKSLGYKYELSVEEIAEMLEPDEIHVIPFDFKAKEAVAKREPLFHNRKSKVTKKIEQIARGLVQEVEQEIEAEKSLFSKILSFFKR